MKRLAKLLPDARKGSRRRDGRGRRGARRRGTHAAKGAGVVELGSGEWRLTGDRIEKAAAMTNWDYAEAQDRFQRIMKALARRSMKQAGAKNGDLIMVGNVDFSYFSRPWLRALALPATATTRQWITAGVRPGLWQRRGSGRRWHATRADSARVEERVRWPGSSMRNLPSFSTAMATCLPSEKAEEQAQRMALGPSLFLGEEQRSCSSQHGREWFRRTRANG